MLLKKNKRSYFLTIAVIITVLLLLLTINKQQIIISIYDLNQKIMSANPGISSFGNLLNDGEIDMEATTKTLGKKIVPLATSFIKSIPSIINYKLFNKNKFDRIDININFPNYMIVMKDRDRAIKDSVLSNPTKVNAKLKYKGIEYKAKIRLKGDMVDHWLSKYRYSLRVKIKNKKTILGFSSFSIHKPRSRQYPYNHIFQSMMIDVGNIAAKVFTFSFEYPPTVVF